MKTIVVLSGKGGVGKSSITAALSVMLSKKSKIIAADCDIDTANLALLLSMKKSDFSELKKISTSQKARVVKACPKCKKYSDICMFNALSWDENNKSLVIDELLCEGCGACQLACPPGVIELYTVHNADIEIGKTKYEFSIVSGQLVMGESGSGDVVSEVRKVAEEKASKQNAEFIIIDASPGIGCPVIASVVDSDYVIAVTEPTPSALADLKRALQVVEYFKIPYGIIINKWDINKNYTKKIEKFVESKESKVLAKLPYDKAFVDSAVNLKPIVIWDQKYEKTFSDILRNVELGNL